MSATLTWQSSGLGTKTGTTNAALIDDLVTLINSKSGDANFKWQVASSSSGSSPLYLVLKRKDGSAGRILLVIWSSAPAGNNAAILDAGPTSNALYGAWFPSGNVDTPSNLSASSGTILGNDTGAVKVWASMAVSTIYTTSVQPFYFDCDEAVAFGWQNPGSSNCYLAAAGNLLVDGSDNVYGATFSFGGTSATVFGSGVSPWSASTVQASSSTICFRTNYGSSNRVYFQGFAPTGVWASQAVGSADILTNTSTTEVWFIPVPLLGQTKGEGFVLKLRQIAYGPGTTGPLSPYNVTGPTVAARQFNAATVGGNGYPWFVNQKL